MPEVTGLANGRAWTRIHVGFTLKSMRTPNLSIISANGSFASQVEIPNSAYLGSFHLFPSVWGARPADAIPQ